MACPVLEIPCANLADFTTELRKGNYLTRTGQWVFRGQRDSSWDLKTSVERAFTRFKVDYVDRA